MLLSRIKNNLRSFFYLLDNKDKTEEDLSEYLDIAEDNISLD